MKLLITKKNDLNCLLGLGSNLPIPEKNLIKAIEILNSIKSIKIINYSSFYLSEPFGFKDQPIFINCAVLIKTFLSPLKLLKKLKKIEKIMGREKNIKYGPRIIDLDILLYEKTIFKNKILQVPHKELLKRSFAFFPCLEIAPDFLHPIKNKKLIELKEELNFKDKAYKSFKPFISLAS